MYSEKYFKPYTRERVQKPSADRNAKKGQYRKIPDTRQGGTRFRGHETFRRDVYPDYREGKGGNPDRVIKFHLQFNKICVYYGGGSVKGATDRL